MALAKSRTLADREQLLIRLVDLCNQSQDQLRAPRVQELLSQIFLDLIFQAEFDIRLRLAANIAEAGWAPPALIRILAFDDIEIARPVIARSPVLADPDLIRIIVEATLEHQIEVARRPGISPDVVEAILQAARPEVVTALAENAAAQVSEDHLSELIRMAQDVSALHAPLAEHPGLTEGLAGRLYAWVGATLQRTLIARFELDPRALDRAISLSVEQARAGGDAAGLQMEWDPNETEQDRSDRQLIAKMHMAGQLRPGYLVKALKDKRIFLFTAALAALGKFEVRQVKAALAADSAEALALACTSIGLDRTVFPTLLAQVRSLNGGHPAGGPDGDKAAMKTFDKIKTKAAADLFRKAIAPN